MGIKGSSVALWSIQNLICVHLRNLRLRLRSGAEKGISPSSVRTPIRGTLRTFLLISTHPHSLPGLLFLLRQPPTIPSPSTAAFPFLLPLQRTPPPNPVGCASAYRSLPSLLHLLS